MAFRLAREGYDEFFCQILAEPGVGPAIPGVRRGCTPFVATASRFLGGRRLFYSQRLLDHPNVEYPLLPNQDQLFHFPGQPMVETIAGFPGLHWVWRRLRFPSTRDRQSGQPVGSNLVAGPDDHHWFR